MLLSKMLSISVIPCFAVKSKPIAMKSIKLSNRLQALADFVDIGVSVADIGADHGYLSVYLAQNNKAARIIASDISAASLSAARRFADEYNVTEAITFMVTPGLDGITAADADTIVIAGMGGETILQVLENAPWTKSEAVTLILQPQSKIDLLCRFLYDSGYEIKETKSVVDKGKSYTILVVETTPRLCGATPFVREGGMENSLNAPFRGRGCRPQAAGVVSQGKGGLYHAKSKRHLRIYEDHSSGGDGFGYR
jgi:tRNA (adenine22-N1)-methyltransferase